MHRPQDKIVAAISAWLLANVLEILWFASDMLQSLIKQIIALSIACRKLLP